MKVRQLLINEFIPHDLLLLADPSVEMIMTYIDLNYIYIAELDGLAIGVLVLYPISEEVIEIKNIAIDESSQNRGIGTLLLLYADKIARDLGFDKLIVGTADVSF